MRRAFRLLLTPRDRELLAVLSLRVKLLSLDQVRRGWWRHARSDGEVRRRIRVLQSAGLLQRGSVIAGPSLTATTPLAVWIPGEVIPELAAVTAASRTRWSEGPRAVEVVRVTPAGANVAGGRARGSRPSEVTHDLHLAEVFLLFMRERVHESQRWFGEAALGAESLRGEKVPDAVLNLPGRRVAVEVCGASYTTAKLFEFHQYCAKRGYGYELW